MQALEKVAAILLPHATIAGAENQLQLQSHTAKGFETKTYPLDLHHVNALLHPFTVTDRLKVGILYLSPEEYADPHIRARGLPVNATPLTGLIIMSKLINK